jgi:hypothetical protein
MAQGILPFKYEMDGQGVAMTGLGGLLAWEASFWGLWGECGLVVDHGIGPEPESSDEGTGSWKGLDLEENEGDPVLSDSPACPGPGAIPTDLCEAAQGSSGNELVASDPSRDRGAGMVTFRVMRDMKGLAIFTQMTGRS